MERRIYGQLIVAALFVFGLALPADALQQQDTGPRSSREDAALRERIHERLLVDSRTQSYRFTIETRGGHVVLRGDADTLRDAGIAVALVMSTRGVRSVGTELEITGPARANEEILADARQALAFRSWADSEADIRVENQRITLTGRFPNFARLDTAVDALSNIEGIRGLTIRAQIDPVLSFSEAYLTRAVARTLVNDAYVDADQIRVGAQAGTIWLEGTVASADERRRAEMLARFVTGVRGVENRIRIAGADRARQPAG